MTQRVEIKNDALWIDGRPKLHLADEYRIYESLVIPAWCSRPVKATALVIRGGDGCAARELLALPGVEEIAILEPDEALVGVATSHPDLIEVNRGSVRNPKVQVMIGAVHEIEYDLVYLDDDRPANYAFAARHVKHEGALVARMPLRPLAGFVALRDALQNLFRYVNAYKCWTASLGWTGFVLCGRMPVMRFFNAPPSSTRYLDDVTMKTQFHFAKDERV